MLSERSRSPSRALSCVCAELSGRNTHSLGSDNLGSQKHLLASPLPTQPGSMISNCPLRVCGDRSLCGPGVPSIRMTPRALSYHIITFFCTDSNCSLNGTVVISALPRTSQTFRLIRFLLSKHNFCGTQSTLGPGAPADRVKAHRLGWGQNYTFISLTTNQNIAFSSTTNVGDEFQ